MQHSFFIAPTGSGTGLTSVCLGMVRAMEHLGVKVAFFKPISQTGSGDNGPERSTHMVREIVGLHSAHPIDLAVAQHRLALGQDDQLMEDVISLYQESAKDADVVIVEGLVPVANENYIAKLNVLLAKTLDSSVILVAAKNAYSNAQLNDKIRMTASLFGGVNSSKVLGCILNKVGAPPETMQQVLSLEGENSPTTTAMSFEDIRRKLPVFDTTTFRCLGIIHWDRNLIAPRTSDIARYLDTRVIHEGTIKDRRVHAITLAARTVPNMLHTLKPGTLVVVPGDREDIFLAACMAVMNGVPLAGIIFTGNLEPDSRVFELCQPAIKTGLPILMTGTNTFVTARILSEMSNEVPADDHARMDSVMESIAHAIDTAWIIQHSLLPFERRLSPPAFRHSLVQRARAAKKRIVLPEGTEPRTIQAAVLCHERGIANCVLLGKPDEIKRIAESLAIQLPLGITLLDPDEIRERYVAPMVQLRQHKALTAPMAIAQLEDPVVLGTMMLAMDEVDGLVSGAIHTTANTIRPALQLIKTRADAALVSSVFFMLLPEQVLVYGDCAVNPDPTASELADIAIQSGDSARAFGIEPRIAMISYSTGKSGTGSDVEKVRLATQIARAKRPDLEVDGPLQYDAAAIASVAAQKAPDSNVAGKATVFIFPDLNTGNTTYKAVQRSANVVSIGPMLQGLRKPVNDLSRGALVEDILYTIALTAIQADQLN